MTFAGVLMRVNAFPHHSALGRPWRRFRPSFRCRLSGLNTQPFPVGFRRLQQHLFNLRQQWDGFLGGVSLPLARDGQHALR
jgi:hypothetical protein